MPDSFASFFVLLIIAALVSAVLHYGLKYYATPGLPSFFSKVVVAYLGAMMGMPVFGAWFFAYAGDPRRACHPGPRRRRRQDDDETLKSKTATRCFSLQDGPKHLFLKI